MADTREMPGTAPPPPGLRDYDEGTYSVHAVHLVRTAMTNHMALSQMADQKANILMGANFLVFTLAIGAFGGGHYRLSLLILAFTAFISAMLAMIAVVPKYAPPRLSDDANVNLLFFGVFTGFPQEEFVARVMPLLETDGRVLSTMLRDIYQNGMVLQHKKYRFLAYAFHAFRIGLVLAFAVFLFENRDKFWTIFS
ncbi:Pycsar system effector family protein [Novosphingobium album (ex Liu et al. 2023)]|uniref:DUF5706 domain-containing protein n=1 Tax=Novosphingobium album (ex Liu et al. 2023) TaxID=3031130 RepID=A0ABT5WNM0_9SPHN|nr:Pycsar system effector family protein [Novosphingobium album (ex Liu et al. 2023)]MDE8651651.1 DUF5706 domain-containing protein [Novosphingobium album (ex Liu et al. 2023)]